MTKHTILQGDAIKMLKTLPSESVHTCVTSPPYYGLRDYGVAGQIGLENSPEDFVRKMIEVFREVRRVLRPDGTLWLNMGDAYVSAPSGSRDAERWPKQSRNDHLPRVKRNASDWNLKNKDIYGMPWRVAFALQQDGWYLRQDIVWHKPNPMPESITDRCTKAHEYIFLLSKSPRYYFDHEAIKEPCSTNTHAKRSMSPVSGHMHGKGSHRTILHASEKRKIAPSGSGIKSNESYENSVVNMVDKRNKRSVWTVLPRAFKDAHFATFPPDLIRPCILAGAPAGGVVLDPFMGSGTTALVARELGRNSIGIELNPDYINIIKKRMERV